MPYILILSFLCTLSSCEIDNYNKPSASFFGGIKDSLTGELVETDILNGSAIQATELGYESPTIQTWVIKNSGEFENKLIFPGKYDIEFTNCNFYPFKVENFEIKEGDNLHDFVVVPYIRIKNLNITHDEANNKITATFSLQAGKPEVTLKNVRLYAFTDIYVGDQVKFSTKGDNYMQSFPPESSIDEKTVYTLNIDLEKNESFFKYHRNYYFRVGALANVSNVGTVRYNYAPYVKISL
jgi:hypothetical protein